MTKLLIVVDMQKDFVDGALGTKEAIGIVDNVVKKIEDFDGDIIVTYDTHPQNYMQTQAVCWGSNPYSAAKRKSTPYGVLFLLPCRILRDSKARVHVGTTDKNSPMDCF